MIPLCEREDISQIVWSPLGQGVLTGKYRPGEPPPTDSRAASEDMSGFMDRLIEDPVLEAVQRLRPVAERAGLTMAQLALAWVLRQENVASAIVGASRPEQVRANASASGLTLDAQTLAAVDEALGDVFTSQLKPPPKKLYACLTADTSTEDLDLVAHHEVARAEGRVELHVVVAAVDLRAGRHAHAVVALGVGLGALEHRLQRDGSRDPVDREIGVDLELLVVERADRGRAELDPRKALDLEEVG